MKSCRGIAISQQRGISKYDDGAHLERCAQGGCFDHGGGGVQDRLGLSSMPISFGVITAITGLSYDLSTYRPTSSSSDGSQGKGYEQIPDAGPEKHRKFYFGLWRTV
jgi:hypothetical protein